MQIEGNENFMSAADYQRNIQGLLEEVFPEENTVRHEWNIGKDATDIFEGRTSYLPRLDVAVGPYNITEYNPAAIATIRQYAQDHWLMQELMGRVDDVWCNQNPRCLLAIEVEFSGSSKHILGDFANASIMGHIGIVVSSTWNYPKLRRVYEYIKTVSAAEKTTDNLFSNTLLFEENEFLELLGRY